MDPDQPNGLLPQFNEQVLAAVAQVCKLTRIGVRKTRQYIEEHGPLDFAKHQLIPPMGRLGRHTLACSVPPYLWMTQHVGRLDLSAQAMAVDPHWMPLFTEAEREKARTDLHRCGVDPLRGFTGARQAGATAPDTSKELPALALRLPGEPPSRVRDLLDERAGTSLCNRVEHQSAAIETKGQAVADARIRSHLAACVDCRRHHPVLVKAYQELDGWAAETWISLLDNFEAALKLEFEDLRRLLLNPGDPEIPDPDLAEQQQEEDWATVESIIRPLCEWRALKLGIQLARFMTAIQNSFDSKGFLWTSMRSGDVDGLVAAAVQAVTRERFQKAITAYLLLWVRYWPPEDDGLLWLPADGDLKSVPGYLRVEESDFEDWPEVLGEPPDDLSPRNVLSLADIAAQAVLAEAKAAPPGQPTPSAIEPSLSRLQEQMDQLLSFNQTILDDQVAAADQLERMVAYMKTTDLLACEEALIERIGTEVYSRLAAVPRCRLIGVMQTLRVPFFASPSQLIAGVASAFEIQAKDSLFEPLFAFLKSLKVEPAPKWPAKSLMFAQMREVLQQQSPAVDDYFCLAGLSKSGLLKVFDMIAPIRNQAVHQIEPSFEVARSHLDAWFEYEQRKGGIFSLLFRPDAG